MLRTSNWMLLQDHFIDAKRNPGSIWQHVSSPRFHRPFVKFILNSEIIKTATFCTETLRCTAKWNSHLILQPLVNYPEQIYGRLNAYVMRKRPWHVAITPIRIIRHRIPSLSHSVKKRTWIVTINAAGLLSNDFWINSEQRGLELVRSHWSGSTDTKQFAV
jgi:hypothetical protein